MEPDVFAISPRIPASCLIWLIEPRAPESAIILIGLYGSRFACSAAVTSSVALFQISMNCLDFSSLEI